MKKLAYLFAVIFMCFASSSYATSSKQQEINKKIVVKFYEQVVNKKDFAGASKYLGPTFIQHNPNAADGLDGLQAFIQFLRDNYPQSHSEIKRVFAEGDYVILHVHSVREPGTRGRAIFDLFRLEKGKVIEHWDTVQDIPENPANSNGMF